MVRPVEETRRDEWQDKYLDYLLLKARIRDIRAASEDGSNEQVSCPVLGSSCQCLFLSMAASVQLKAGPDKVFWLLQAVKDRKYDFSGAPASVLHSLWNKNPLLWCQQALHDACLPSESQGSQAACSM